MLRVILDTNVIVSAFISPNSVPGRVLRFFVNDAKFVLVLSPALVDELRHTLRRPRVRKYVGLSERALEARIAELEALADPINGTLALNVSVRDPDDVFVIAAAVEGRADYVVTGDNDLLTLGAYEGVPIVTPRAFLDVLNSERRA